MSIALIASNTEMIEFDMVYEEIKKFKDDVEIVLGHLSQSVPVAKELEEKGIEVFIARGATVSYLKRANLKTPVVEMPITLDDLSNAIYRAKAISGKEKPRIGAVIFYHMLLEVQTLAPLLGLEMKFFTLHSDNEADSVIDEALKEGIDVLLGGVLIFEAAKRRSVPVSLLQSGRESFLQAVREAKAIVSARRTEKQRLEELRAILDYAYGGIIAVNKEGMIDVFNAEAERITGIPTAEALGKKVKEQFPLMVENSLIDDKKIFGELLDMGQAKVMMNRIPIKVHDEITGMVGTFQEVVQIERMEKKIRRNIYTKGHTAKFSFQDIYGESSLLREAKWKAKEFARTNSAVMISGETGVGKELFAQSIHQTSPRRNGPFVAINCAALPENLLESELFGYVEGAFTGANRKGKKGLFELAHEGTIFLDEVSEIPLSLQGMLLRVLQENEVMRLGHDRVIPVNIRIISGTNKDLKTLVQNREFRDDLYWRLNVLNLFIPPLRKRKEDIPVLIEHFLELLQCSIKFDSPAFEVLTMHHWPGNIRELINFCERLSVMNNGGSVGKDLVVNLLDLLPEKAPRSALPARKTLTSMNIDPKIKMALEQAGGNKTLAAKALGMHRVTLWRYLKKTQ